MDGEGEATPGPGQGREEPGGGGPPPREELIGGAWMVAPPGVCGVFQCDVPLPGQSGHE